MAKPKPTKPEDESSIVSKEELAKLKDLAARFSANEDRHTMEWKKLVAELADVIGYENPKAASEDWFDDLMPYVADECLKALVRETVKQRVQWKIEELKEAANELGVSV